MENQLDIQTLAKELGMMHITIMQLRQENDSLKKRLVDLEESQCED